MEPAWIPGGYEPIIINAHQARPGQRRGRLASEHADHRLQMYYTDGNGLLVPAGAAGARRVRAASASPSELRRPAQIVINNEFENHSPQRSPQRDLRRRSHGHDYHYDGYSSDSWDERAPSPRRHRRRSHHRRSPSRSPSPYEHYDFEKEKMKAKLEELERKEHAKEEEERARDRYEKELAIKEAKKAQKQKEEERARERYKEEFLIKEAKKAQKQKEEEAFKNEAIKEYHIKEAEEKLKREEEKKKAEEEYKKRARRDLEKAGMDEEEIERILKGKEKAHAPAHGHGHGHAPVTDLSRPTYVRVHRKHLCPETLDIYDLPWGWDERDANYIIIKRWIPEHDQPGLFEHTRRLRERKQLTDTTIELKKERDQLLLVRKRSPSRKRSKSRSRVWLLT